MAKPLSPKADKARKEQTTPEVEYASAFIATIITSPRTAATYRFGLKCLADFISDTKYTALPSPYPVAELHDDVLLKFHDWLQKQRYAPASQENYIAATKRFLIWLDANDRLPQAFQVGKAVNRLKAAHGSRRSAKAGREPDPGIARIVTYYDGLPLPAATEPRGKFKRLELLRARAVVHTLYASAGRVSEVASLTREMVLDGRKREIRITGKGNKDRLLLLTQEAQQAIAAYCNERDDAAPGLFISHGRDIGKSLGRGSLWAIVKRAAKALGLFKGTSPHAFRHFRAQQLLHEGMDLDVLQTYLGHADISTTRRIYAPYTAVDKVRDQLETFGRTPIEAADDSTRKE